MTPEYDKYDDKYDDDKYAYDNVPIPSRPGVAGKAVGWKPVSSKVKITNYIIKG